MKRRLLALLLTLSVLVSVMALVAAPAGAYYGQTEGYVGFRYAGSSTQGCQMELFVMPWRRVQAYCQMQNGSTGAYASFTNWIDYWCDGVYNPYGCTYYVHINAQGAPWHPIGCWEMIKDNYSGQHALIMDCYPQ